MILEAKYIGPHSRVSVPGYQHRESVRGKDGNHPPVKIRVPEGRSIGGCWEIVKGKKEYDAGLKAVQAKLEAEAKALAAKKKAATEAEAQRLDKIVEASEPKPAKKGAKS